MTRPVEQYRKLFQELREDPARYFDCPSSLGLRTFLAGYEHGDPAFIDCASAAHDVVVARYPSAEGMSADTILYLNVPDLAKGYELYISAFLEVLHKPEVEIDVVGRQPLKASIRELLPDLRARAPMLIGSWDARDLYTFFQGFFRALDDCGHDTTRDRRDLDALEKHLQTELGSPGRWDRLLFARGLGQGRSAVQFVDVLKQLSCEPPS